METGGPRPEQHASIPLRENHSGMETHPEERHIHKAGCVRTIVVWKHGKDSQASETLPSCVRTIVVWKRDTPHEFFPKLGLRENHSGMETVHTSISFRRYPVLRENHSGMETHHEERIPVSGPWLRENHSGMETTGTQSRTLFHHRCVRTIVVWKHQCTQFSFVVRELVAWEP